jgi:8-oxo-dGTP pyrophosphatase MutT (NUDIX family)
MGMFSNFMGRIFGKKESEETPQAPPAASGAEDESVSAGEVVTEVAKVASKAAVAAEEVVVARDFDVTAYLDGLTKASKEKGLDWRKSIVDMMKLVGIDSSLSARRELAEELGYKGDMKDSAKMNIWLHREMLQRIAANGGQLPDDLLD